MNTEFAIDLFKLGLIQTLFGFVLGGAVYLYFRVKPNTNAATRYRLWLLAFALTALLPIFALLPRPDLGLPTVSNEIAVSAPAENVTTVVPSTSEPIPNANRIANPIRAKETIDLLPWVARLFVLFWLVTLVWRGIRLSTSLRMTQRYQLQHCELDRELTDWVDRNKSKLDVRQPVEVYQVGGLSSPMTVGFLKPWIAIPSGLTAHVDDRALEHALFHELAHIRRKDAWMSLFQQFMEVLWAFNPALVWMNSRINLERENACDDWAIQYGRGAKAYATSLLDLLEARRLAVLTPFALGCIKNKSQLSRRITSMLDKHKDHSLVSPRRLLVGAAATMTALLAVTATALPDFGPLLSDKESPLCSDCGFEDTLLGAAARGDVNEVQRLIDEGVDVNTVFRKRSPRTALNTAAIHGHLEVVKLLVENGADVKRVVRGDAPAVTAAARSNNPEIVQYLLNNGAEAEQPVRGDGSALIMAAATGNLDMVTMLVNAGADVNTRVLGDGTPLISAAREGHTDVAQFLLDRGADPNRGSMGDEFPLFHALNGNHTELVTALIDAGADVNKVMRGDPSPLMMAIETGDRELIELLMNSGADVNQSVSGDGTALISAARAGDVNAARRLIAAGANVNLAVRGDGNPLIMAAIRGDMDMVRLLVESGADVNGKVKGDDTVLINAVRHADPQMVSYLLQNGADATLSGDFDWRIQRQRTPLNQATESDVADMLKQAGATD